MAKVTSALLDKKITELKQFMKEEHQSMFDNFVKSMTTVVDEIKAELAVEKTKTVKLESSVAMLKQQVKTSKKNMVENSLRAEQNEQYSRRTCLRIDNIPLPTDQSRETEEDCLNKVKEVIKTLKVDIPDVVIDRAHRIGRKPKPLVKWGMNQSMIVKFTTWRHRTAVYRARNTN